MAPSEDQTDYKKTITTIAQKIVLRISYSLGGVKISTLRLE